MAAVTHVNGLMSPPQTEKANSAMGSPPRVVLAGKTGRILCVADIRGDYHELNRLIREHEATAVIHTGDFGFINADSLERMGDKILNHLLQYSPLLADGTRSQLLSIPASEGRSVLIDALNKSSIHFPLSQFPHLLTGAITFPVPVFTVWGLIEDVRVLEKFRTGEYEVHNLNVVDEASSRVVEVGGIKLRLFGLGGAVVPHKLFDNGEGFATIAGGQGTMWATALQIGELVDTAARVYDPTETRLFITSAPVSRNGTLSQLAFALKADLTISGGLHFRYPASFNDFSVHDSFESYRAKLSLARENFLQVYNSVKDKVDSSLNEEQLVLLKRALSITQQVPDQDDGSWTNTWHWVLSDASCGHLFLSISDSRVSAETKSKGLNFSHRSASQPPPPSGPITPTPVMAPSARRPSAQDPAPPQKPAAPIAAAAPARPSASTTVPPKPMPAQAPTNIRGIVPRPQGPLPAKPAPPQPVAQPAAQTSTATASAPTPAPSAAAPAPSANPAVVPPKPVAQPPRAPRGPGPVGAAGFATPPVKDKEQKLVPPRAPAQARNPPPNGKPTAPTPPVESKPRDPPAPNLKDANGSSAKLNGDKMAAAPAPAATPGSAQIAPTAEKKDSPASSAPSAAAETAKEESATPAVPEKTPNGAGPRKSWSLYLKGIPTPTTDDDVRGLFGDSASKITAIKIIMDHMSKKQRDYAYVDYKTEEDMQEALKANKGTIRETPVNVSVSNPPTRNYPDPFRGRGRGGFRGARGGMRGGFAGHVNGTSKAEEGGRKEGGSGAGEAKKEGGGAAAGSAATPKAEKAGGGGGEKKE